MAKAKITIPVRTGRARARRPRRRRGMAQQGRALVSSAGQKYARCVLDPHGGMPAKIPDGSCHSVLIEYNLSVQGTPNSGLLAFMAFPGLPCSAGTLLGSFTGPNREGISTSYTVPGVEFPFKDFTSGVSAAVAGTVVLYNSATTVLAARCISLKLEVVPTGALLNQGGSAVTVKVPLRSFLQPSGRDEGTAIAGVTYAGNSDHPAYVVDGSSLSGDFSSLSAFPDAKVCSGTESCVMLSIPPNDEFVYVYPRTRDNTGNITMDAYPTQTFIYTAGASGISYFGVNGTPFSLAMGPSSATDIAAFGNFWQPEISEALVWSGQGLPSGQSYTFRVRSCMELMISHGGSTYRPFVTPPEPRNEAAISMVRDVMAKLPPSLPKAESAPGWWASLTEAATGIGDVVSSLGLPFVSPVAGIATKMVRRLIS